jgi:putative ABC transport system permease protein
LKRTDGNYWKVLEVGFIEGQPLSEEDNINGRFVAVINRATRDQIFGEQSVLGESIKVNGQSFEIIGVVENEAELSSHAYGDVWVPISTNPSSTYRTQMMGGFVALLLSSPGTPLQVMKDEYQEVLGTFEYEDPEEFEHAIGAADTKLDSVAREVTNSWEKKESGAGKFIALLSGAMLVFMLLPTINLVNLNTSRILERASEIGVRKAFGASSSTLVGQFIVENLVLTVIGGLVGFTLAFMLLDLVAASGLIKYASLHVNYRVFLASLALIGIFGVISGAYPAWRMSRLQPVDALRGA